MKSPAILAAMAALAIAGLPTAAAANPHGCPPGLAKKNPPCVPPGQARKGSSNDDWDDEDHDGHYVDRNRIVYLDNYPLYHLPPLPRGSRYAVVNGNIVVIDEKSYRILQWIRVFTALTR